MKRLRIDVSVVGIEICGSGLWEPKTKVPKGQI